MASKSCKPPVSQPKPLMDHSTKPPKAPPGSCTRTKCITVADREDVRNRAEFDAGPDIEPPSAFIESATIDPTFIPSLYVSQNLVFAQVDDDDETKGYEAEFYMKNISCNHMVFKVKSSCPNYIKVEPAWGMIEPQDTQMLNVQTIDKNGDGRLFSLFKEDELQLECTLCPSENMNMAAISMFWARTPAELGDVERYTCNRFMLWDPLSQAHDGSTHFAQNNYETYTDVLPSPPPPLPQEDASGMAKLTGITRSYCQLTFGNSSSLASLVIIFWIILIALIALSMFTWFSDFDTLLESYFQ